MSVKEQFLEAMSRAAATVCIVTTDGASGRAGVTVSAMTSVSADGPAPTILVCVNANSSAAQPIQGNQCFAINVMGEQQQDLANVFAARGLSPGADKFDGVKAAPLHTGAPLLEGALATFDCTLLRAELIETHWVLIGAVRQVHLGPEGAPLLYGMRRYLKANLV